MERVPQSINERRVFVDTTAFVANMDCGDVHFEDAGIAIDRLIAGRFRLFTTKYVIVETHATLLRAMDHATARQFLIDGLGEVSFLQVTEEDEEQAKALIIQQRDKDYSFCDAISFTVMKRLGIYLAFSFDDHFRQFGLSTPLTNPQWP